MIPEKQKKLDELDELVASYVRTGKFRQIGMQRLTMTTFVYKMIEILADDDEHKEELVELFSELLNE